MMQTAQDVSLSTRQAEIARLIVSGKSTREIALALTLSPRTVETHIAAIYNKYGVSSRAELIIARLGPSAWLNENAAEIAPAANTNLPARRSALLGRATDVANVVDLIRASRLVTLTGAGGVGKTRAALEVGEAVLGDFTAGVWFVELALLARGSSVADAIARAVGFKPPSNMAPIASLCFHLRQKSLALIIDNCEHLMTEAAAAADALLRDCPHVRILTTSREPLRIAGERAYRLPSLRVPSSTQSAALDAAGGAAYASIELFTQRARAVDFAFTLTDENVSFVADICRRVDGIPLAIELAAARVNIVPVHVLASKIEVHLRILGGSDRMALPRHQTMHALIDWSYDLLEPREQRLFERLSVFAGGCALPEAVTVYGDDRADEGALLDMLSSLVDKSLVVVDASGPQPRYWLLRTFAQYGFEKLAARGDAEEPARRHALAYVELAERLEAKLEAGRTTASFAWAEHEIANWRAALEWALEARNDVLLGLRLVAAMRYVWLNIEGAQRWLRLARELIDERTPPTVAAAVRYTAACINFDFGDNEQTIADCRQLSAEYERLGNPLRAARSKAWEGSALFFLGRSAEAQPLVASALQVAREHAHAPLTGYCLDVLAHISFACGDVVEGRARALEAIATYSLGDERGAAITRSNLADNEFGFGNIDRALQLATSSLVTLRQVGLRTDIARALTNLAVYCIAADRWVAARRYAGEALKIMRDTQHYLELDALRHLSAVAALAPSDAERPHTVSRAARLLGYADARSRQLGYTRQSNEQREYDRVLAALGAVYPQDVLARHMADGAALAADQAIALAMSL